MENDCQTYIHLIDHKLKSKQRLDVLMRNDLLTKLNPLYRMIQQDKLALFVPKWPKSSNQEQHSSLTHFKRTVQPHTGHLKTPPTHKHRCYTQITLDWQPGMEMVSTLRGNCLETQGATLFKRKSKNEQGKGLFSLAANRKM